MTNPSPSQAAAIAYFHNGTRSGVRFNQASYTACEREGWIEPIDDFPFHRATDDGIRAIGLEPPVHLHTGFVVDGKAVCGERVTEQTKTATDIDKTTCVRCAAAHNTYRDGLKVELGKFARREAPYDQATAEAGEPVRRISLGCGQLDCSDRAVDVLISSPPHGANAFCRPHTDERAYLVRAHSPRTVPVAEGAHTLVADARGTQVGICRHCGHYIYLYAALAKREGNWWRGGEFDETGRCGDAEQRTGTVVRHEPAMTTAERDAALAATVCGNRSHHPISQCRPHPADGKSSAGRMAVAAFHDAVTELLTRIRAGEVDWSDILAVGAYADAHAALGEIERLRPTAPVLPPA